MKLEWRENIEKQRFEPKIPGKIGFTQQPFIKYLEKKKIIDKPMKIGKPDKPILINKEKAILLKIGHGNPENLGIK